MSNNVKAGHKNKQSYANTRTTGKEQYYTTPEVVDMCLAEVQKHINLKERTILEPCGGTGEFIEGFLRAGVQANNIISFDIEPKHAMVEEGNYLDTEFEDTNLISITNPPFGRTSSLAKKFFNHAANHSDYICYLIPKSWRKWTTMNSLDSRFHLISDIDLPMNCFYLPDGTVKNQSVLNTVFQIWEKRDTERQKIEIPDNGLVKKILPKTKKVKVYSKVKETAYKLVDGEYVQFEHDVFRMTKQSRPDTIKGANFEMIVFGHSCGKCRELDPDEEYEAKTTTMYFQIDRDDVKQALQSIDFSVHYNNVSYVQALSLQEINYELNKHFGLNNFTF
tara:strand:- start:64 stop:1068 length:1005 start_codon:yes stop_codon:yes gene_type:complete